MSEEADRMKRAKVAEDAKKLKKTFLTAGILADHQLRVHQEIPNVSRPAWLGITGLVEISMPWKW